MRKNKPGKVRVAFNILPFVLALIVFAGVRIGTNHPGIIEHYYSKGIYPAIAAVISLLSSTVSFSLWDLSWIAMIVVVLTGVVLVVLRRIRIAHFTMRFLQLLATLYSVFYILWGFNYFRPGIGTRLGWQNVKPEEKVFRQVLDSLITGANRNYVSINTSDYASIEVSLENSYRNNSSGLQLVYPNGSRKPKTILVSSYFAKSGVSGYFGPFFNEVHLNQYQLPQDYPFNLAHEKAHQFGLANEAEANLAAFIVCTSAADEQLRYSGFVNVLLYFLDEARDMPDYHDFLKKLDRNVLRDLVKREEYYDNLRNKRLENIQAAANNAYLKSQKIKAGIKNYNEVIALTIDWYITESRLPAGVMSGNSQSSEKVVR